MPNSALYLRLNRERRAATAARSGIRVVDLKIRGSKVVFKVYDTSFDEFHRDSIRHDGNAVVIKFQILITDFFVKIKRVLKPGTTATVDCNSQHKVWFALNGLELRNPRRGAIGDNQFMLICLCAVRHGNGSPNELKHAFDAFLFNM